MRHFVRNQDIVWLMGSSRETQGGNIRIFLFKIKWKWISEYFFHPSQREIGTDSSIMFRIYLLGTLYCNPDTIIRIKLTWSLHLIRKLFAMFVAL